MEVHEFGSDNAIKIVMIPGNMMCWKQFEHVIPLLEQDYHVGLRGFPLQNLMPGTCARERWERSFFE